MTKLDECKILIKENQNICLGYRLCGLTRDWATCWNDRGAVAHLMRLGYNWPYNPDSNAEGHRLQAGS